MSGVQCGRLDKVQELLQGIADDEAGYQEALQADLQGLFHQQYMHEVLSVLKCPCCQVVTKREKKDEKKEELGFTTNPVYERRVISLVLVCSLSSHRHSYTSYL